LTYELRRAECTPTTDRFEPDETLWKRGRMPRITARRNTYVVEALVALGLGGLLAYLLSGPLAGATADRPHAPDAPRAAPADGAPEAKASLASPAASTVTLPGGVPSPRKSTQTVQKFK
jgi:hypothetical protein